jgi:ATP-binding cassette subfamily B protein
MADAWSTMVWPSSRTGEAVVALARARRLAPGIAHVASTMEVDALTAALGLEAEPIEARYDEVEAMLAQAEGVILRVVVAGEPSLLLVVKSGRHRLVLLTPELQHRRVSARAVRDLLCAPIEETLLPTLDQLLATLPRARRECARRALMRTHLAGVSVSAGWLVRVSPAAGFFSQLYRLRLCARALRLVGAYALAYGFWIWGWWLVGAAALAGRYDAGWWQAWVLLLVSLAGLQALSSWQQTQFLIGAAAVLKRRLLHGALRLDQDQVRREGAGQLLGRVLESETIESLALSGGLTAALALFEIAASMVVLAYGSGGVTHVVLLVGWLGLVAILVWRYTDRRRAWTASRLALTHHLTEQMLGHRTRVVQQPMAQWHDGEDESLSHYHEVSQSMDRLAVVLATVAPRGWLIVGLVALAPALFAGSLTATLAVGLGGCLLAYRALQKSTLGLMQLAAAAIAWDQVAPVFRAGTGVPLFPATSSARARSATVLFAQDIVFRYRDKGQALLRGVDLQVHRGERILLEGASGGGKSTLAALITGLRVPESGLLLLHGLDRQTLGDTWRRQAVNVPQFHENYILSESLAFNLLMGRGWPPMPEDLDEAEALCRTLGLGDLLDRMPSGLWQIIGENGWQLSHGERSRVYLARALLQRADLIVFDESFAALDPENLSRAIECVIARAPSLVVIAHP